jgi:hypothetical protein
VWDSTVLAHNHSLGQRGHGRPLAATSGLAGASSVIPTKPSHRRDSNTRRCPRHFGLPGVTRPEAHGVLFIPLSHRTGEIRKSYLPTYPTRLVTLVLSRGATPRIQFCSRLCSLRTLPSALSLVLARLARRPPPASDALPRPSLLFRPLLLVRSIFSMVQNALGAFPASIPRV